MIRILVCDDHEIVRRGLAQLIGDVPDMCVAGSVAHGAEVLEIVRRQACDVVVLDIAMPGMNGLDVLKAIRRHDPDLPVLLLTIYPEEQYAIRALRSGASGYVTKESAGEELITAIRAVAAGRKYISAQLAERLAGYVQAGHQGSLEELLSDREYEIMQLLVAGKRNKEIAHELCISPKTVSTHRMRILRKMDLTSNADLIRYAQTHELVG